MSPTPFTSNLHAVLEAKLVAPEGLAFSIGSEFIDNPGPAEPENKESKTFEACEHVKQDCELKAFTRLTA